MKLPGGTEDDFRKLQMIHTVKTLVVGYEGWKSPKSLVENYRNARKEIGQLVPNIVFYPGDPGACVIFDPVLNRSVFTQESPFSVFFQKLLQFVTQIVSSTVKSPGINAEMQYTFNKYFSLALLSTEDIDDSKFD